MCVQGQSCDCPAVTTCGTCSGGLLSLTLRYTGSTAETITAEDQIATVFSGVVNPNTTFSFVGSIPNEKFVGTNISLTVGGLANATIPSICGSVFIGNVYGNFVIVEASSKTGGPLCCSPASMETTPPQITGCPANFAVDLPAAACQVAGGWTPPIATDNCTVESFDSAHGPTDLLDIGVTTVTYTAIDKYGNSSRCSFDVTVSDNTMPDISSCPADITIEAESSCQSVVSWTPPTASDNCSVTLSESHSPGSVFVLGTTTVSYTASDPAGNTTTCSFNVVVTDTTVPLIAGCPGDITIEAGSSCQSVVSWTPPTATDNCSATMSESHSPGSVFALGTTTVSYTATDPTGNITTCSFNVTVRDTTVPVITGCPADISISSAACDGIASWTPPTATDNCTATLLSSHQPGNTFPVGTTTVTYTAADSKGNTSTCSFKVIVQGGEAPTITGCPDAVTVHTFYESVIVNWEPPQATATCGSLVSNISHQPGTPFTAGITEVSYKFTDGTTKESTCAFNITVIKDEISFEVSNVVTPNGDGINDTWWVTNIEKFTENSVVVVDRWGNRIYHSNGYDNATVQWAGLGPNGSRVPVGTYFYTIEVRASNSVVRDSGFVEVIY
jgi:gliding motility-associated-like protein